MTLRINHNTAALNGHRMLLKNDAMVSKSLERLSSGMRINKAADNAAGLVISEQMRAQITGLAKAIDNSETGVSMVQTAEGSLDEVNSLLNKARELVLHAANSGANDSNQLAADQAELDNVVQSITRISEFTQFGTKRLLDGSLNGATALSTGLSRVKVGNLANNPTISNGTVTLAVSQGTNEGRLLRGGATDTTGYVFTAPVTGVNLGANLVRAGVTVAMTVGTGTVTYITTGFQSSAQVSAKLTSLVSGYTVTASTGGGFIVKRSTVGNDDFNSQIRFYRGATATVSSVKESVEATVKASSGPGSMAAGIIFGTTTLSGVRTTSLAGSGTIFTAKITTAAGGTNTITYTATGGGSTMQRVLSGLQTSIRAIGAVWTGARLSLGNSATSGFTVALARGVDTVLTDFNFTLEVDYPNAALGRAAVNQVVLNLVTGVRQSGALTSVFFASGATSAGIGTGDAFNANANIASGIGVSVTINAKTAVYVTTGRMTLTALGTKMNTVIQATAGVSGYRFAYVTGGANLFGGVLGSSGVVTGTNTLASSFFVSSVSPQQGNFSVSLSLDQKVGNDANRSFSNARVGSSTAATLNLDTTGQVRTSGQTAVTAHGEMTISNAAAQTIIISGADVTAAMTTSNGVTLSLNMQHITASGVATLVLNTGVAANRGYQGISIELSTGMTAAGGFATYDLTNGAKFQVGPNASQTLGVTIDSTSANELGRNVTGAGVILSLYDMISSQRSALTNGLTTEAIKVIDAATNEITNLRGKLGAVQANAFETGIRNLRTTFENLTAAESTIRDSDFAAESAEFTKNQILTQASQAMLAQANQMPQNVLKLLQ